MCGRPRNAASAGGGSQQNTQFRVAAWLGKRVAVRRIATRRRRRKKIRVTRHTALCSAAVSTLLGSLTVASPALAQVAAPADPASPHEQALPAMQLTPDTTTTPSGSGARVAPVETVSAVAPVFPRLRLGVGWEGTIVGGGYLAAGGPFGVRLDIGARINRWIGFYTRLSGATLLVSHVAHAAAMVEFYPHRMIALSAGVGYVTFAYTPFCLFGCGGPRSNEAVTMPVRFTLLANRSSDDQPRGGFSVGAEIFPGYAVGENGGPIIGGGLFVGYSRM